MKHFRTRKETIIAYANAVKQIVERHPLGITENEARQIARENRTNLAILFFLKRLKIAIESEKGKFVIHNRDFEAVALKIRKETTEYNRVQQAKKRLREQQGNKIMTLAPDRYELNFSPISQFSDADLISELKTRGFEIQRTVTNIIKY